MVLVWIMLVPGFAIVTLYRMWLNAQVYRIKGDFHGTVDMRSKNLTEEEIDRMNESSWFVLICFFSFFWFKYSDNCRPFQMKSNLMMLVSIVLLGIMLALLNNAHVF
jgi:hypothetical protein